jgi:hypothetical protein
VQRPLPRGIQERVARGTFARGAAGRRLAVIEVAKGRACAPSAIQTREVGLPASGVRREWNLLSSGERGRMAAIAMRTSPKKKMRWLFVAVAGTSGLPAIATNSHPSASMVHSAPDRSV